MTPEERQLISGLFDRMRSFGVPVKDREAEVLINQSVRSFSDTPYMLVQSALVQEQALEQAHAHIQDLEEYLRAAEEKQGRASSGAGSFLGRLFGGGRAPAPSSTGDQSPWRQDQSPAQQPAAAPAPSGGFMHSAMTTAAGVAGGVLVSGAIRDMLGGRAQAGAEQAQRDHAALARQDAQDDAEADLREQDARDDAEADLREQDARDDADADASNDPSSDRDEGGGENEI